MLDAHAHDAHGAAGALPAQAWRIQFDDPEQQKQSSVFGMWMFLLQEILFFGAVFVGYAVYRSRFPDAFAEASHHLQIGWGFFNTLVLIGSSYTMVLAVHGAEIGDRARQVRYLLATMGLGTVFLLVKVIEYSAKFEHHLVPGPSFDPSLSGGAQLFFSFYFAMTGMHALHMVIGLGLLTWLLLRALGGQFGPRYYTPVEIVGLYWHFVDIVWIFLFPLLYLIGLH